MKDTDWSTFGGSKQHYSECADTSALNIIVIQGNKIRNV